MNNRIDTHFHIIPSVFAEAIKEAGGDPSGWTVPEWSPSTALEIMKTLGIGKAVLSVSAPGPAIAGNGEAGRKLARDVNIETQKIVDESGGKFGWFASLPDWTDVEGTVAEMEWVFSTAKADGFVVMTNYGDRLLGDPSFQPVWDKLEEHKAIIFIHPTSVNIIQKIAGSLPQPMIDYPLATTRTAVDLIVTKTVANHPQVKIILSHAGGTLPFLAERLLALHTPGSLEEIQIRRDLKTFWLDLALSTSKGQLQCLLAFTTPEKILYGSDSPYAPIAAGKSFTSKLDDFVGTQGLEGQIMEAANSANAKALFGW